MTTYVFFRGDNDGRFAAFTTYLALREKDKLRDAVFTELNYGDKFPMELDNFTKHDDVYILGFLLERKFLDELDLSVGKLVFINHMQSALEKLHDASYAILDTTQSTALITWEHFFQKKRPPILAMLITDHKLQKKKHPETPQMVAWLNYAQLGQNWEKWEELMNDKEAYELALKYGRFLIRYNDRMIEDFINTPGAVLVQHGHLLEDHSDKSTKYAVYNRGGPFTTDTAKAVIALHDVDYTIEWHADMGRDVVVFEIRSRDSKKFSAMEYAELERGGQISGGGQPDAAGFVMNLVEGLRLATHLGL